MITYPFTIHNIYTSERRDIQRLVYDTNPLDKYGYFYGAMEIIPFSLQVSPEEKEIEDINDLITMMTQPEGEIVIIDNKTLQPLFYNIDISRVEIIDKDKEKIIKVFFKATKDDRTSDID